MRDWIPGRNGSRNSPIDNNRFIISRLGNQVLLNSFFLSESGISELFIYDKFIYFLTGNGDFVKYQ